ncbi:MAG: glycosyltransferase family 4 protein [Rhodospirillales bacterium]|nr:glycosyltransferase family 4 protein [Rhodospirillales bacterium]
MRILFLTENFPPETNAAATRVYERACYWVKWGHAVTVITQAPNFPEGRLHDRYTNLWRQVEDMSGIRVVRVKTFIAPNKGVVRRSLDFLSFMVTGVLAGLGESRPDIVAATSPQFFAAVGGWALAAMRGRPFVFELGDLWPASIAAVGAMRRGFLLGLIENLELFLYRRAEAVVALTQAFKDNLVQRGSRTTSSSAVSDRRRSPSSPTASTCGATGHATAMQISSPNGGLPASSSSATSAPMAWRMGLPTCSTRRNG